MKRLFVLLVGAISMVSAHAQVLEQEEPAMVYYTPLTTVVLDFTYSVETREPGIYAQFAESMLGIRNAVDEKKTIYTLDDVSIHTSTSADLNRPHKVTADAGFPLLLTINEKGLLLGYNLPPYERSVPPQHNRPEPRMKDRPTPYELMPTTEEMLKASSPLAQAHAAAKQIFHLRETRMYLLNGEVEHTPADGEAMKRVMDELDKQELALIELFTGKKHKRIEHKQVRFIPDNQEHLWYFSTENGFTDAENIDAYTITVTSLLRKQVYAPTTTDDKKKKKNVEPSQLVYNIPGSSDIKVLYRGTVLGKRTIPVAQLGIDVPVAKDLLTGHDLPTIVINEKTGNIISISK